MAKHQISSKIVCPFCKCDERMMIYCEGVLRDTTIHLAFAYPSLTKEYRKQFCESSYMRCRIAQMLNAKYEEDDDEVR